jgi:hypothetical protein
VFTRAVSNLTNTLFFGVVDVDVVLVDHVGDSVVPHNLVYSVFYRSFLVVLITNERLLLLNRWGF